MASLPSVPFPPILLPAHSCSNLKSTASPQRAFLYHLVTSGVFIIASYEVSQHFICISLVIVFYLFKYKQTNLYLQNEEVILSSWNRALARTSKAVSLSQVDQ